MNLGDAVGTQELVQIGNWCVAVVDWNGKDLNLHGSFFPEKPAQVLHERFFSRAARRLFAFAVSLLRDAQRAPAHCRLADWPHLT
jgi:hypothetical protein